MGSVVGHNKDGEERHSIVGQATCADLQLENSCFVSTQTSFARLVKGSTNAAHLATSLNNFKFWERAEA